MLTAVEIDQWLQRNLACSVLLGLRLLHLLLRCVQRCHVCVVVLRMVQFHDLAANSGLQCAIVVYNRPV